MLHRGRTLDRLTKPSLVAVSHAIERTALACAEDGPMVVIALFQRMPYFERERALYERVAGLAAATVVGMVAPAPPLPPGVTGVLLADTEELAREWTVVVLTPRFGAVLVAHDRMEVEPSALTLEAGRVFDGWWGFRRDEALHEVLRLREAMADRLDHRTSAAIDHVTARVRDVPATPGEPRAEAAIRLMVDRAERIERHARTNRLAQAAESPVLDDHQALRRWTGTVTASGTLPVALVGLRFDEQPGASQRIGRHTVARERQAVLAAITSPLRPVDRAVRLDDQEYLLVLPSLGEGAAVEVARRVTDGLAGLARSYPFVEFAVHTAVTVTDRRPLPLAELRSALGWATRQGVPMATLGNSGTPVASSRFR